VEHEPNDINMKKYDWTQVFYAELMLTTGNTVQECGSLCTGMFIVR